MAFTNRIGEFFRPSNDDTFSPALGIESPASPRSALEVKQALLAHYIRLVARGISNGLFVAGQGGAGKSRTISLTLADEEISPVLVNSHITPLSLYRLMYEHRTGKVLWLDDCDSIYGNMQVLGLLRSALWGQGDRTVTYTSSQLDDIPSRFSFDSRIIFCANSIPKRNEAFLAVLSRVDVYTLSLTNEEAIEQMKIMAASGYRSLSATECLEVVDFIRQFGGTRYISMRLYEPALKKRIYAQDSDACWQELVACQLQQLGRPSEPHSDSKSKELEAFAAALEAHPDSVKNQEDYWCEATGKSRASFFRTKKAFYASQKGQNGKPESN